MLTCTLSPTNMLTLQAANVEKVYNGVIFIHREKNVKIKTDR